MDAPQSPDFDNVLTLLRNGPPRISACTAGLSPARLHTRPSEDEWSASDVLAHLRACSDVWGSCIEVLLTQDGPTIRAINPRTWIKRTDYREQAFVPSLTAFTTQRDGLLATLESLTPEAWSRSGIVTGAGKQLERTVLFYAQWLARHEQAHLKQIEHVVGIVP